MKTGILGGTFNPIHNSHLYLARQWKEQLDLGRVLLVPTYVPPHKSSGELISAEHRLAMCVLAVNGLPWAEVCDYEVSRAEKSYSYKTLEYLREICPEDEFFFLMGADMFLTVQNWYKPERIFELATICGAAREDGEMASLVAHRPEIETLGARTELLRAGAKPLSSTEIRERIKAGESVGHMIPCSVGLYITEHGLYRGG